MNRHKYGQQYVMYHSEEDSNFKAEGRKLRVRELGKCDMFAGDQEVGRVTHFWVNKLDS